jgi:hypothetical protein
MGLCYVLEPVIHNWVLPIGIFALVAWFFAAAAYYIHVGRLLEALGASVLTAVCFAMMVINVLAMLTGFVQPGHGDSLGGAYTSPTISFGGVSYVAETFRTLGQVTFEWWVGLGLILYTTVLVIHVRLLVLLMRTDKELKQRGMETPRVRIY